MVPYTTLKRMRDANACEDRYAYLVSQLGEDYGDDIPITLVTICDINGIVDAWWIPNRIVDGDDLDRRYQLFAVACCLDVPSLIDNQRSRAVIKMGHLYAYDEANEKDLLDAWEAEKSDEGYAERIVAWNTVEALEEESVWERQAAHFKRLFS